MGQKTERRRAKCAAVRKAVAAETGTATDLGPDSWVYLVALLVLVLFLALGESGVLQVRESLQGQEFAAPAPERPETLPE
ncbi:MAG: hypothetical protein GY949_18235 [Gammaproteobacteria bacterium]|nr:hypothetical protein [Gammaproteobacteria bacterium]